jgi:hypothetical protein
MDTKISKLNQNIRDILGKEGLAGYEVNENPENRTAEVRCSGTMVLIRGRDPISVREKKLKEFASPILEEQRHRLLKETMNLSYGSSINLIKSDSTSINLMKSSIIAAKTVKESLELQNDKNHVKEGEIEFDLIESERNGKKYYTCPCGQTYNQKGHAKWNHIKRHLNRKQKKLGSEQ